MGKANIKENEPLVYNPAVTLPNDVNSTNPRLLKQNIFLNYVNFIFIIGPKTSNPALLLSHRPCCLLIHIFIKTPKGTVLFKL